MRSPPGAPESGSTREFADLDGVGVALQAKAAQALPGILVGQVEAPLQVLRGRLLHVQLLSILLVKEANFLLKRRRRWSVRVLFPARLPHLSPKASLPGDGSFSFLHWSARKMQEQGGRRVVIPVASFSFPSRPYFLRQPYSAAQASLEFTAIPLSDSTEFMSASHQVYLNVFLRETNIRVGLGINEPKKVKMGAGVRRALKETPDSPAVTQS